MATEQDLLPSKITVGAYIFYRIYQLGIRHVFGCPGDFNLNLLDHLYTVPLMKWIGTCNELNAAYSADGYARIRGVPGVLVTTYGVGELSAINGIAAAYSEHIPIIHIVGTTSRLQQHDRIMTNHTLGENWDHTTFQAMSEPVRKETAFLTNDATFTLEIDRIIRTAVKTRQPTYLFVPMDVPDILIDPARLARPLDLEIRNSGHEEMEDGITALILKHLEKAVQPAILVDVLAHRYGATGLVADMLEATNLPTSVTPLAKSAVDETCPNFIGLYNGELSPSRLAKDYMESSDLVLHIGPLPSVSNTGGWSQKLVPQNSILFHPEYISIKGDCIMGLHFVPILRKVVTLLREQKIKIKNRATTTRVKEPVPIGALEQHNLWKRFDQWLKPNDCIIAEAGSAQYGTLDFHLQKGCQFITQIYYTCTGFTVGALLGALVAGREQGTTGRTILFIGDGSLHMTVQELSTVIRHGFRPTIVLINNRGYTIDRIIHGPARQYNNIAEAWDYQNMLKFFGARESRSYVVRTFEELDIVLEDPHFQANDCPQLLEVILDKLDAPWMLTEQMNIVQSRYAARLEAWDKECGRERRVLDSNRFDSKYALRESVSDKFVIDGNDR
ncbi:MAG: hypothetical protein M1834_004908 [Cirrosporium novae-zelandiae]|nr:MAG: hypothetical protein M1834_004908 [Cirrosporium novae-zelandiae]